MKILLIDGYIDTPGCLGVPPYLSPISRYIFGVIKQYFDLKQIKYYTIDLFREKIKNLSKVMSINPNIAFDAHFTDISFIIFISGVSVPGKYLGGTPIKFSELKKYTSFFPNSFKILCGPATNYGIGEQGGKPSISVDLLKSHFNLIIYGDSALALDNYFGLYYSNLKKKSIKDINIDDLNQISQIRLKSFDKLEKFILSGSELVKFHPNFSTFDGGNLICEIETFKGCPRYKTGGCAFCIEPLKGETIHREIISIVSEIVSLYKFGVRHFRLGSQTDFYAYKHGKYINERYPKPNPEAIKKLLSEIRIQCPEIKTLHIDNVNALNFTIYPSEAILITQLIVKYCTEGNIAAIGVESVDLEVIKRNNLKATPGEIINTIKIINQYGNKIGKNGNPYYLPGLNFIMGLPGETKESMNKVYKFLNQIKSQQLHIRRINLRKLLIPTSYSKKKALKLSKHLNSFRSIYFSWKKKIRDDIDHQMLKKIFPFGRILTNVYAEIHDGKNTILRQPGTYPITCYVNRKIELKKFYNLIIINHGYRSLTCLVNPVNLLTLTLKELESIDGIGKKRALSIKGKIPSTLTEWKVLLPEIWEKLSLIQPDILK